MSKFIKKIAGPALGALAGSAIPGIGTALGASLGSGIGTLASGGNLGQAALSAGGSYLGGNLGNSIFGNLGTVGSALGTTSANAIGPASPLFGNIIGNSAGAALANTSLSSALGSFAGNSLANSLDPISAPQPNGPAPFSPSRQDAQNAPASFSGLGDLTGEQQTSNLANQGVYGGGLGPDEQSYFLNLVNRQLVDNSGQTQDMGSLQPIENSYLQQLGLGGYGNSSDLLQAISKWKQAA